MCHMRSAAVLSIAYLRAAGYIRQQVLTLNLSNS